jgi:hypothetical protein
MNETVEFPCAGLLALNKGRTVGAILLCKKAETLAHSSGNSALVAEISNYLQAAKKMVRPGSW